MLLFSNKLYSSVQFSRSVVSDSLRSYESQHSRPPCSSPTPGVHSDSRPSSPCCHPAVNIYWLPIDIYVFTLSGNQSLVEIQNEGPCKKKSGRCTVFYFLMQGSGSGRYEQFSFSLPYFYSTHWKPPPWWSVCFECVANWSKWVIKWDSIVPTISHGS